MYLTEARERLVPPKDKGPLPYCDLLTQMEQLCNRSRQRNHHEMFSIGYLFSKFKLNRFEDL